MLKTILSEEEIQQICQRIALDLDNKFKDKDSIPVFIGVMKGALPFMMDIIKNITIPCMIDFIQVSSYEGDKSSGTITLKKELTTDVNNKDIVIIEDVIDTGITFDFLKKYFTEKYSLSSITMIALLDKKCKRVVPFEADIIGKEIGNDFVLGYGLDYNELGRNYPYVFVPTKDEIKELDNILNKKG